MSVKVLLLAELAEKILGPKARSAVEFLIEKGEATDEQVAKALEISINEARKLLNILFENRLVKYRRTRDEKIGWYTYYWRITDEDPTVILEDRRRRTLALLEGRLNYEQSGAFYYCPKCGKKYSFDEAAEYMFRCIECDEVLEYQDNYPVIEKLKETIEKLRNLSFTST